MFDRAARRLGPVAERRGSVEPLGMQPDVLGLGPSEGWEFLQCRTSSENLAGFARSLQILVGGEVIFEMPPRPGGRTPLRFHNRSLCEHEMGKCSAHARCPAFESAGASVDWYTAFR